LVKEEDVITYDGSNHHDIETYHVVVAYHVGSFSVDELVELVDHLWEDKEIKEEQCDGEVVLLLTHIHSPS
jgi:hypothetical protein